MSWAEIDAYIAAHLVPADPVLEAALAASEAAGLPPHQVAPNQGKLLELLARLSGARRVLEIGTLGGYSTLWLARALPADGAIVTLEADPRAAEVARKNLAGLTCAVDVLLGPALETLPSLAGPFDLVFIDADKQHSAEYFDWALRLARVGAVIVCDNVVRAGAILDPHGDASAAGVRRLYERMAREPRITATALQTVGDKGHDGFAIALVRT
jgi:predicted O-methyltransferase YrrM